MSNDTAKVTQQVQFRPSGCGGMRSGGIFVFKGGTELQDE